MLFNEPDDLVSCFDLGMFFVLFLLFIDFALCKLIWFKIKMIQFFICPFGEMLNEICVVVKAQLIFSCPYKLMRC